MDYKNIISEAVKDLETFDLQDLQLMARYYEIPIGDKKTICRALIPKIYDIHRGNMKPIKRAGAMAPEEKLLAHFTLRDSPDYVEKFVRDNSKDLLVSIACMKAADSSGDIRPDAVLYNHALLTILMGRWEFTDEDRDLLRYIAEQEPEPYKYDGYIFCDIGSLERKDLISFVETFLEILSKTGCDRDCINWAIDKFDLDKHPQDKYFFISMLLVNLINRGSDDIAGHVRMIKDTFEDIDPQQLTMIRKILMIKRRKDPEMVETIAQELGIELFPYKTRTQVMQAMARGEITRKEGREMLAQLSVEPTPTISKEKALPKEAEDCSNVRDYFTQKRWTVDNLPEIKLRFLPTENLKGKPYVLCIDKESLLKWLETPDNEFRGWYPTLDRLVAGRDMDPEGHGGRPSSYEGFYKLPGIPDYVANSLTEITDMLYENNVLIGYPIYTKKRIGNRHGVFGIGMIHGQEPGYTVYYMIPETADPQTELLSLAQEIYELKTGGKQFSRGMSEFVDNLSVEELLNKIRAIQDTVPMEDLEDDSQVAPSGQRQIPDYSDLYSEEETMPPLEQLSDTE